MKPAKRWIPLTPTQQKFFQIFDEVPTIDFKVADPTKRKLLADGSTFDLVEYGFLRCRELNITDKYEQPIERDEIAKLYIDSWKCVQKDGKRFGPMWKDKRRGSTYNSVTGRNYYHAGMFRSMPELSEGSEAFYDWANTKIRAFVADDFGADADKLLAKAIECDDVVSNGDPFKAYYHRSRYARSRTEEDGRGRQA